ncbi:MAG: hypothetical protein ACQEQF_09495, partial [Bacillota bacterium]
MKIEWNIIYSSLIALLPLLSLVIMALRKIYPEIDPYFMEGKVLLEEIDDIIDAILLEYPKNIYVLTIDEIIDKVIKELNQAGYELKEKEEKKISYHIKGKLKKEPLEIEWKNGDGLVKYNKK